MSSAGSLNLSEIVYPERSIVSPDTFLSSTQSGEPASYTTISHSRSGEVRDVMIDFSGAVLGIALSTLVFLLICRIKKKRTEKNEERKIRN